MSELSSLDDMACFQVYTLHHAFGRYYQAAFAETGFTYPKFVVLKALAEKKELSLSALSARLGVEANTLSPLAKKMAAAGVIERARDARDERRIVLRPTTYGLTLLQEAEKIAMENFAALGINQGEAERAIAVLSKIRTAVEKAKPGRMRLPEAGPENG